MSASFGRHGTAWRRTNTSRVWLFVAAVLALAATMADLQIQAPAIAEAGTSMGGASAVQAPELTVVSQDPYTNRNTYHRTEAEPDTATDGSTVVATFQVGRAYTCGSSNIGWSVSRDAGNSWTDGMLPGTTVRATPPGPWIRATDPAVAYDAKHDTWLVEGQAMPKCDVPWKLFISRSIDGARTFEEPIVIGPPKPSQQVDKPWITFDNTPTSPYFGNCYTGWTDHWYLADRLGWHPRGHALMSSDGGLTWTKSRISKELCVHGIQLVVQPNGNVVMPFLEDCAYRYETFVSSDGGLTYSGPHAMPPINARKVHGLVAPQFASVDVDAGGKVYAAWADCQFRTIALEQRCPHNDIVMSTSQDGRRWTDMIRIPIDPSTNELD